MSLFGKIASGISSAVSSATSAVTEVAKSATQTVSNAEASAEKFVKSEYQEAKSFVKLTGAAVTDVASQASSTVSKAVSSGVKELQTFRLLPGATFNSASVAPQGDAAPMPANSGNPAEVVKLDSRENVQKFLESYGQIDQNSDTASDQVRCQSNTMIAGLLMKGGPEGLKKGLESARNKTQEELKTATGGRKIALERAVANYDKAIEGLKSGNVTRGQLDHAADALFTTMVKSPSQWTDKGELNTDGIAGVDRQEIFDMEATVGLRKPSTEVQDVGEYAVYDPRGPFVGNKTEVATNVWGGIKNGESAHVGVNQAGRYLLEGHGPNGEPIQTNSQTGEAYYLPKGAPDHVNNRIVLEGHANSKTGEVANGGVNHAVLFGKNADGTRYIYDPAGTPPFISEKPGDPASSAKLDALAAALMPREKSGFFTSTYHAKVTSYGGSDASPPPLPSASRAPSSPPPLPSASRSPSSPPPPVPPRK